jgi:hypothetical protein
MKIALDLSESETPVELIEEISSLTDKARIHLDQVVYDKEAQRVKLPLSRRALGGHKSGLFRARAQTVFDTQRRKDCMLTVECVTDFREARILADQVKTVTILFGLKISGNTIHIESAEEDSGQVVYKLNISVEHIDLRLEDLSLT